MDLGILVPITLFISIAAVKIFKGPFGTALAERLGGRSMDREVSEETEALHADVDALRDDLDDTRAQLAEVQERLDFAERLLAAGRASPEGRSE